MIIYQLMSPSGKSYVGQTTRSLKRRWQEHCGGKQRNGTRIRNAIKKYSPSSFLVQQLSTASNQEELNNLEKVWIILLQSADPQHGYNLTWGGENGNHTEQSKQRISIAKKGKPGKPKTLEQRQAMSLTMSGRDRSDAHRDNLRKSQQGEKAHQHKLTEPEVLEIRSTYVPWEISRQKLADKYGVSRSSIQNIIERTTWRHL
jgi:group I intron endonuclease